MGVMFRMANGWEWETFVRQIALPEGARIGIYSAGGTTEKFLKRMDRIERPRYRVARIIDKHKKGDLSSIPVVDLDTALEKQLDFIVVTTFAHYYAAKADLIQRGLLENRDFSFVYFFKDIQQELLDAD